MARIENISLQIFSWGPVRSLYHIKNMGWIASLIFTESGTDYTIAKYFGQVKIEMIEIDYQGLEIATQPTDIIKKLKFLYN